MPNMRNYLLLILAIIGILDINTVYAQGYPIDKRTSKICYSNTITINASKEQLFKRAEQFIASQNFGRIENIRCKNKSNINLQIVNKPIVYQDFDEGKYIGNGFVNFEYKNEEHFIIIFKYKIAVNDNSYKYEFTDFQIWDFITAPKNKGKSHGMAAVGTGIGMGASSGSLEFSASDVRKYDLEEFINRKSYKKDGSDKIFQERIKRMIGDLNTTMNDNF